MKRANCLSGLIACVLLFSASHAVNASIKSLWKLAKDIRQQIIDKKPLTMMDFGGYAARLHIPSAAIRLGSLTINTPTIVDEVDGYKKGFTVKGSMLFDGAPVAVEVIVVDLDSKKTDEEKKEEKADNEEKSDSGEPQKEEKVAEVPAQKDEIDADWQMVANAGDDETGNGEKSEEGEKLGVSAMILLPENWKLTNMFPSLTNLDNVSLPTGRFFISNFEYKYKDLGVTVKRGLNFVAGLELTGPFEQINKLIAKLSESLALEATGPSVFQGVISPNLPDTKFMAHVPARFGVDFEKLYQAGKLNNPPSLLKRISIGDFKIDISVKDMNFFISGALIFDLTTQEKPLFLRSGVSLNPKEVQFGALLTEYDPAFGIKWLGFNDLGATLRINFATAAATTAAIGVPFNLVLFQGGLRLGVDDVSSRFFLKSALGFSLNEPPEMVFEGSVDQIKLTELVKLLVRMVRSISGDKTILSGADNLPEMEFSIPKLMVVPRPAKIIDLESGELRKYRAGVIGRGRLKIDKFEGFMDVTILSANPLEKQEAVFRGFGVIKNIDTPIFKFTGPGLPARQMPPGPVLTLEIDGKEQKMMASGTIEIPALKYKQGTTVQFDSKTMSGSAETKFFGLYEGFIDLKVPIKEIENFYAKFGFKQESGHRIKRQVFNIFERKKNKLLLELAELESKAANTHLEIDRLEIMIQTKLAEKRSELYADIERKRQEIKEREAYAQELKRQCSLKDPSTWFKKCLKSTWESVAATAQEAATELRYLEELVIKAEGHVASYYLDQVRLLKTVLDKITFAQKEIPIGLLEALKNIVDGLTAFELTIEGEIDGQQLKKGVIPHFAATYSLDAFGKKRKGTVGKLSFFTSEDAEQSAEAIARAIEQDLEAAGADTPAAAG